MPELVHDTHAALATAPDAHECAGCLDRRQLLVRAGAVGLGAAVVGVLAACSGGSGGTGGDGGSGGDQPQTPAAGGALAMLADVPVGGAVAAKDGDGNPIIIAQPESGTVVAMTAICTHQGCTVAPDGKQLKCPCHGSIFSLTGANVSGLAPSPLAQVDVHVSNGEVLAGKA